MSKEDNILNKLKKTEKVSVPNDYFDTFFSNLKLNENDTSFIETLPKNNKPEVSTEFFETFLTEILTKLDKPKKGKIISLKSILISVASIAAVVSLLFLMTNLFQTDRIVEIEYNTEEYLAFVDLDESDYIDFIIENNISIDDEIEELDEELLYELYSELDTYYYEL